jgi:hypothetical protein
VTFDANAVELATGKRCAHQFEVRLAATKVMGHQPLRKRV